MRVDIIRHNCGTVHSTAWNSSDNLSVTITSYCVVIMRHFKFHSWLLADLHAAETCNALMLLNLIDKHKICLWYVM